jgi:hypothetical protein
MVDLNLAFDVVLAPVDQPPKVFGVIYNSDRIAIRARRIIGRRG